MAKQPGTIAQVCFVDMPFGEKVDARTGTKIDFDKIYRNAILPAIENSGLKSIRGDQEKSGGIIHAAMFARLLLSEFVVADLTTANANVFYELGVRHSAKPYTTIPIFATIGDPPFDVNMVRCIPYSLEDGKLTEDGAQHLRSAIEERIRSALEGPVAKDSPLFQLFENFPGIEVSHELTDVFMDRLQVSEEFQTKLDIARTADSRELVIQKLDEIAAGLGDLRAVDNEILMKMFLTYRDASGWDQMISLFEKLPSPLQDATITRQQLALALNRRSGPGDREKAVRLLEALLEKRGESAETYGILGRVYKDQYKEAKEAGKLTASAKLDKAIDAYKQGFLCEPADYYPGVNAVNLLIQKGTEEALREAERLTPLVSFAVARRGGTASADYWDLATVLELAVIGRDYDSAESVLPKVIEAAKASWMAHTTADNLELVLNLGREGENTQLLKGIIRELRTRASERSI